MHIYGRVGGGGYDAEVKVRVIGGKGECRGWWVEGEGVDWRERKVIIYSNFGIGRRA